jgi:hypothetical protein
MHPYTFHFLKNCVSFYNISVEERPEWVLVIAAMRNAVPSEEELRAANLRTVVMNRDDLCAFFGPTFFGRAVLYLQMELPDHQDDVSLWTDADLEVDDD